MSSLTPERMSGGLFARDPYRTVLLPVFGGGFEPAVNLYESDGTYTLECAVPGYGKDDITVDARADRVTIAGAYSREIGVHTFARTIVLPEEIDADRVAAKLVDGLLTIVLRASKAAHGA
jgi:HSP20 family protein